MDVRHNNNALKELNNCIGGLLHLGLNVITSTTLLHIGPNVITFRTLLHLGPNFITFRTLLHLGQLLHLGLQLRQRRLVRDLFIGKTTDTYWKTHSEHIVSTLAIAKSVLMKPLK